MFPKELTPYLAHLRALPFVRGVRVLGVKDARADYALEIRGVGTAVRALVELKKSHVSAAAVDGWVRAAHAGRHKPEGMHLLFAPSVGQQLGDALARQDVGFVDLAGNCYVNLAGTHMARIQGRRAERKGAGEKGLRAPAYRALFALLAEPDLASATVRAFAEAAGVSRQAAHDLRPRLEALGCMYPSGKTFGWTPRGRQKALEHFLSGYTTTLRPQLVVGRYRTPGATQADAEARIARALTPADEIRWGGGAAAMRLTGYYRGERTVLHADAFAGDVLKRIQAIPSREGPLELLRFPGPLGARGATPETAHPLLVYAELMHEGQERAADAAQQILQRWLPAEANA